VIARARAWWTRTGSLAREIVAKRTAIVAGATTIAGALVTFGVIPLDLSTRGLGVLVGALGVLSAVVSAVWTRQGVTPADPLLAPTSSGGVPLIEAEPPGSKAAALLARDLDDTTPAKHDARE